MLIFGVLIFGRIRYTYIYSATVPDRMHHLDLGLFRYQIEYIYELLKLQHGNVLVEEVDRYLSVISHYSGLKIFANELQSIARLTANEYRIALHIVPPVLIKKPSLD